MSVQNKKAREKEKQTDGEGVKMVQGSVYKVKSGPVPSGKQLGEKP